MRPTDRWRGVAAVFFAASVTHAAQPPDNVASDANGNTAGGSFALGGLTTGMYNTGFGYGTLYGNTTSSGNTAVGNSALFTNTTGSQNSAFGLDALAYNLTGASNTALGEASLFLNTSGTYNTAVGEAALFSNTTGSSNTGIGQGALHDNSTGTANTAIGDVALFSNTTGGYNTAIGFGAFQANATGGYTTAVGAYSLSDNTSGGYDTAFGAYSLPNNTTGTGNTAFGYAGLRSNTSGNNNIGFGYQTLYLNTTGSSNIAMGYQAGYNVANGSENIEIGNMGQAADAAVIRIGAQSTQTAAYVAGISGAHVTGSAVYVTSAGQLGVLASSERYKTAIAPMGEVTDRLRRLRPVSFQLKTEPEGAVQYGLIAEEVDRVYPELVVRDETGTIQGVRYDELAPMLLNEVQKQAATEIRQAEQIDSQARRIQTLTASLRDLQSQMTEFKQFKHSTQAALKSLHSNSGQEH